MDWLSIAKRWSAYSERRISGSRHHLRGAFRPVVPSPGTYSRPSCPLQRWANCKAHLQEWPARSDPEAPLMKTSGLQGNRQTRFLQGGCGARRIYLALLCSRIPHAACPVEARRLRGPQICKLRVGGVSLSAPAGSASTTAMFGKKQ